ncbi:HD domain-containing protein [Streptomyces sp. B21-083]|uniref:HD domain-containing protein n=1 Tax=Streptomyces sp. B21-083 TaxID=3039410 RepID=UPI002FF3227E
MPDQSDPESRATPAALAALRARWTQALEAARATTTTTAPSPAPPDPTPYADNLLARYQEPQRRYHTLTHLTAVLDHIDVLEAEEARTPAPGLAPDLALVRLAAWFHDAVYAPDRSENEERSARLAERALTEAGVSPAGTAEVARLVRLTLTHDPAPDDRNGQVLCDADLAILAAPEDTYAAYTAAVREEYAFVPDDAFRAGRAAVLRQLLALPRLFRTPYGTERWEEPSRANIAAELRRLEGDSGPI